MNKIDRFIPVIVFILICILGILLYNNKYNNQLYIDSSNINKEFNLTLKDVKKKYGNEDNLKAFDKKNNACYCYNKIERCYCINKLSKVKGILILNDYKNISIFNVKIDDTFDDVTSIYKKDKIKTLKKDKCIKNEIKHIYDTYDIKYSSNYYCNNEKGNKIEYIIIEKTN